MQYFRELVNNGDIGSIRSLIQQHQTTKTSLNFEQLLSASYDCDQISITRELLESRVANPNLSASSEGPLLLQTVWDNQPKYTKLLLENGADPNQGDKNGITPLMVACVAADVQLVRQLLLVQANVNQVSQIGTDAVYYLVSTGCDIEKRVAIAKILSKRIADTRRIDEYLNRHP